MEGKHVAAYTDPIHICNWWQFDRICGEKDHECFVDLPRLVMGNRVYIARYDHLANDGVAY